MAHRVTCTAADCGDPATWVIHLVVRPVWWTGPGQDCATSLSVCDDHKLGLRVEDVLTDEAWVAIEGTCREQGCDVPDRRATRLRFERLGAQGAPA